MDINFEKYLEDSFAKRMIGDTPSGEFANSIASLYLDTMLNEIKNNFHHNEIRNSEIKLVESVSLNAYHRFPAKGNGNAVIYFFVGIFQVIALLIEGYLSLSSNIIFYLKIIGKNKYQF